MVTLISKRVYLHSNIRPHINPPLFSLGDPWQVQTGLR